MYLEVCFVTGMAAAFAESPYSSAQAVIWMLLNSPAELILMNLAALADQSVCYNSNIVPPEMVAVAAAIQRHLFALLTSVVVSGGLKSHCAVADLLAHQKRVE